MKLMQSNIIDQELRTDGIQSSVSFIICLVDFDCSANNYLGSKYSV